MSIPVTVPWRLTSRAAISESSPVPHPRSSTCIPVEIPARRKSRSVSGFRMEACRARRRRSRSSCPMTYAACGGEAGPPVPTPCEMERFEDAMFKPSLDAPHGSIAPDGAALSRAPAPSRSMDDFKLGMPKKIGHLRHHDSCVRLAHLSSSSAFKRSRTPAMGWRTRRLHRGRSGA
jgi:hypothetical protein